VTLKWAVDAWASAPAEQKTTAFAAAEAVRWAEYALQSFSSILLGLTLILYGLAITLGTVYPRWLGWVAAGSGVAWIVHGLMVPYIGLFDSIPRGVGLILLFLWAFIMAFLMWRNSSPGRIARPEVAPPEPAGPA
jgi:predicted anti-sigma-YlaC factor YlaD